MVYSLSDSLDMKRFCKRIQALMKKGSTVELTEVMMKTVQQNRYLHLLLGVLAMETGNRMEFVKQNYLKKLACPDIFIVKQDDGIAGRSVYLRSVADLSKEEMSLVIERFKVWSAEQGYYMPDADNKEALEQIEVQMRRMQQYL